MSDLNSPNRWYQIPIVWLVWGIPLFSIVFTLSIVWISVKTYDGVVVDDYYRKGLEINRALERDERAARSQLEAHGRVEGSALSLQLQSNVNEKWPDILELGFYHPTLSYRDVIVSLRHVGLGLYSANNVSIALGKWNVATGTREWRLSGVYFHPSALGFELNPLK